MEIIQIDKQCTESMERIWSIQQAAYPLEAKWIGFDRIPPLMESFEELCRTPEFFLGCMLDQVLVGAISYEQIAGDRMEICRMMVHPPFHRQGVASRLLAHFLQLNEDKWIEVCTGEGNEPAIQLYQKHGFRQVDTRRVNDRLQLICFEKSPVRDLDSMIEGEGQDESMDH
ncbi:GNAT family N-acetyltransferase [Marinicrinis sediminis]|uniref:GNAT family N-acetyltransferase n=1 Tax=Marinicrinis sediminis TaxID=1652465 RepID=A0ABW5RCR5_9BACL